MQFSLVLVCEVDIDASTQYRSRTFVAYHLLELHDGRVSFHGVGWNLLKSAVRGLGLDLRPPGSTSRGC